MMGYDSTCGSTALGGIWGGWATSAASTTTAGTGIIWGQWTQSAYAVTTTATTTSSTTLDCYWVQWVGDATYAGGQIARESEEQKAQRIQREAETKQRQLEEQQKREAAKKRAEELLVASLDSDQQKEYQKERSFTVLSKDGQRKYRIQTGRSRNVQLLDASGRVVKHYCAHPAELVPDQDTMLAQKLMLEHAEDQFLKIANVS